MNAGNILTPTATSYPEQIAWIWDDGLRTYSEANARAPDWAGQDRMVR